MVPFVTAASKNWAEGTPVTVTDATLPMALEAMSVTILREILGSRLERVTVTRFVTPRRGVFEPGRLHCEWLVREEPCQLSPQ